MPEIPMSVQYFSTQYRRTGQRRARPNIRGWPCHSGHLTCCRNKSLWHGYQAKGQWPRKRGARGSGGSWQDTPWGSPAARETKHLLWGEAEVKEAWKRGWTVPTSWRSWYSERLNLLRYLLSKPHKTWGHLSHDESSFSALLRFQIEIPGLVNSQIKICLFCIAPCTG